MVMNVVITNHNRYIIVVVVYSQDQHYKYSLITIIIALVIATRGRASCCLQ